MTKFGAVVRRIFLAIFMALFLVACVTKAESNTSFGSILYMGMLISGGIFFLFSVVSIIIRVIRGKKMDSHDSMTSAYTDVLMFLGNINTINYFRRISFWGTVMLLIYVFVMKIPSSMILGGPYSSDLYLKGYHGFLLWSAISLVILFFVTILFFCVLSATLRRWGI